MTTQTHARSTSQNRTQQLTAKDGGIATASFLKQCRMDSKYHARCKGLIRFPSPRTIRCKSVNGSLGAIGFVNGQFQCIAVRAADGGNPVFIDKDELEDPNIWTRWIAERQQAVSTMRTPSGEV